jgi:hypothetical protein
VGSFNGVTLTVTGTARVLSGEGAISRVEAAVSGGELAVASLVGYRWSFSQSEAPRARARD